MTCGGPLQDMLADSHCIPISDDVLVTDGFCHPGPVGFAHDIHDTLCFTNNSGACVRARAVIQSSSTGVSMHSVSLW